MCAEAGVLQNMSDPSICMFQFGVAVTETTNIGSQEIFQYLEEFCKKNKAV
jgi:hypothetical protein